jgi:hypothetical protein
MSDPMNAGTFEAPASVGRLRQRALLAGGLGVLAMAAGALTNPAEFFHAYLGAFIFWTSLSLGCLGLLMVHHLSGGAWGLVIRRILEAGARTLPLMLLAFVPLTLGLPHVYEWAQPDVVAKDPILQHKAPFLNAPFWILRTVVYFALWSGMAYLLAKWSREQDGRPGAPYDTRFGKVSGPGLVVFGLTVSLASVDWMMSVDPHWFSTIYGFVMVGGAGLSALCLVAMVLSRLAREAPMSGVVKDSHFHDIGKLTFAFVMLYAYFTFSQFLIIWSANLPEEIPWYLRRLSNGWQYVMLALVLLHFALPFALLLSANIKQQAGTLARIAGLVFVMRFVDVFFQVAPQFHEHFALHWQHLATAVGLGGLWFAAFASLLGGRPVLPVNDPYFQEALADHGSH